MRRRVNISDIRYPSMGIKKLTIVQPGIIGCQHNHMRNWVYPKQSLSNKQHSATFAAGDAIELVCPYGCVNVHIVVR